jgi:hypothetical protein
MPAIPRHYPCHVCEKTHVLYLPHGTVPDFHQQLFYIWPWNGIAVRVTKSDGWEAVEAQPKGSLMVHGTELSNRVAT